jgi:hypothetical protein
MPSVGGDHLHPTGLGSDQPAREPSRPAIAREAILFKAARGRTAPNRPSTAHGTATENSGLDTDDAEPLASEWSEPSLRITPPVGVPPDPPRLNPSTETAQRSSRDPSSKLVGDSTPPTSRMHRSVVEAVAVGGKATLTTRTPIPDGSAAYRVASPSRQPSDPTGPVVQRGFLDALGDAVDTVTDVASSAADTVSDVASSAAQTVSDVAGAVVDTVSDAASSAADAVSGLIDSAVGALRGAFDAIVGQISGAWNTVKNGVTSAVEGAIREASGFLGGIGSLFGSIGTALSGLDAGALRAAWSAITGAASAALAGVKGIIARVTSAVDGLWSGLKGLAEGLIAGLRSKAEGLIGDLPGVAQGPARSLWKTIEGKLTSTWRTIESGWKSLRDSALKSVNQVVAKVEGVVKSIKNSVISTIIDTLDQLKTLFDFIKKAIANPESLIEPLVQEISARLQGLPDKAKGDAQAKTQEQAASGPGAAGPTPAPAAATAVPAAAAVQRVIRREAAAVGHPRSTLGVGDVISGCWDFITDKLAKLWGNLGGTIKEMVLSLVWPPATWAGLKQDWEHMTKELSTRASRFESIRTDSWDGFWEDLGRFLSNLVDFPLIIWRGVNAMLGRLSVYIGLAIILGGAVAGAIAGGTGGAIFGSVVPAAGNAAGGVAGVAAGAWAGAQAGYAAAETVGLALLVSFVAAEQISVVKAINDLLWIPQTEDEQNEDFNQSTDSVIAMATAGLLMLIAFVGVALAKRVWTFVKGFAGRFRAKPTVVEPEPVGPKPGEPVPGTPERLVICRTCDIVPDVPADLMAKRAKLTPEARARLDKTAAAIYPDPANPTPAQHGSLRSFMEAMERKGGGDLEAGLQKLIEADAKKGAKPPQPSNPPFGPAADQLPALRSEVEAMIAEIDDFAKANPDKATITKSATSLRDVADGPLTEMENGRVESSQYLVDRVKGSLKGAKGELESAKTAPPGTKFGDTSLGPEIDQIHPDGTLHQVKRWEPFGLADQQYAKVKAQLELTLETAQKNPINGQPRKVVMEFQKGVKKEVADALRAVEVNGQRGTIVGTEVP